MKKIITMLILVIMFTSRSSSMEANAHNADRFELIQSTSYCDVVVDTETGVEYAVSTDKYNWGNMTVLVDADGNPLIYKGVTE